MGFFVVSWELCSFRFEVMLIKSRENIIFMAGLALYFLTHF